MVEGTLLIGLIFNNKFLKIRKHEEKKEKADQGERQHWNSYFTILCHSNLKAGGGHLESKKLVKIPGLVDFFIAKCTRVISAGRAKLVIRKKARTMIKVDRRKKSVNAGGGGKGDESRHQARSHGSCFSKSYTPCWPPPRLRSPRSNYYDAPGSLASQHATGLF